jgi:hypothetical protein
MSSISILKNHHLDRKAEQRPGFPYKYFKSIADSAAKPLLMQKGCINIQSERWRSMDAAPFGYS